MAGSRGVNKVILIGHLGADPEVRRTANNLAVATIRLATNQATKDKQTGEWTDTTEWHRVVFFDRLAEVVEEYLRKGSQIYVEGRLRTQKWQDQEGKDRWTTEIVANDMQMLGRRGETVSGGQSASRDYGSDSYTYTSSAASEKPEPSVKPPSNPPATEIDDDIPF